MKSTYLRNKMIDAALRGINFTAPAAVYAALHSGAPGAVGSANELVGNGYVRTVVVFGGASGGTTANQADVTFPVASGSDWALATYFSLWDAQTSGNCLYIADNAFLVPKTVQVGDNARFSAGALTITET